MKKMNIITVCILLIAVVVAVVLSADTFVSNKIKSKENNQIVNDSNSNTTTKKIDSIEYSTSTSIKSSSNNGCYVGGCSGEICGEEKGMVSNCIYKKDYSCYKKARCERHSNGKCGWTQTEDLKICLSDTSSI